MVIWAGNPTIKWGNFVPKLVLEALRCHAEINALLFTEACKKLELCFVRHQQWVVLWNSPPQVKGKAPSLIPWMRECIWSQFISDWVDMVTPWCPMCSHACDFPQWPTTLGLGTRAWRDFTALVWHRYQMFHAWEVPSQVSLDKSLPAVISGFKTFVLVTIK